MSKIKCAHGLQLIFGGLIKVLLQVLLQVAGIGAGTVTLDGNPIFVDNKLGKVPLDGVN